MSDDPSQEQTATGTLALLRSTFAFGSMTTISRITGLVRDIVFAQVVGSTFAADAFFVAFRIPNFFRRIFGEGAFSAAFVPVYTQHRRTREPGEVRGFVNLVTGRLALILLLVTVVGILAAPVVVTVIAPGFRVDAEKFTVTVEALRWTFPYLLFICLVALSAGILNTCGQFAIPAATPILLNLTLIGSALWLTGFVPNLAVALAIGVFIAGVLQLIFQIPFLVKSKVMPRPALKVTSVEDREGAGEVYRLMLPAIFGASVAQINLIINTIIASFLVTGSVSWLYYSDRLMEFPLGVFGVALGTVLLPRLSNEHVAQAKDEFSGLLDWGMRWCLLIALPATIGLITLAEPLVATLFHHGAFTQHDVLMSARALVAFSFGLIALVAVRVLAPGFFARKDTKTPVRVGVIAMAVNTVLGIALVFPLQHVGLALATSLAAFVNAGILLYLLMRDKTYLPLRGWSAFMVRVLCASSIMGAVLWWSVPDLTQWLDYSILEQIFHLAIRVLGGMVLYLILILTFGIKIDQILRK